MRSTDMIPMKLRRIAFESHPKDFRYYEVIQKGLKIQFEYRFLVMQDAASGEWAIQPLFFLNQDLAAGVPMAARNLISRVRKFWPGFLKLRILMVGCIAAEGHPDHTPTWVVGALRSALDLYSKKAGATIILFKDVPSDYRKIVPSAEEHIDRIYEIYLQTYHRSNLKFEELNKDYFRLIGAQMPDRVRYFSWLQNSKIIALSLCLLHGDTLYDLDLPGSIIRWR